MSFTFYVHVVFPFSTVAGRGRACHCSLRSPSPPITTAHHVNPLVGPVPGSLAMLRTNSFAEMPSASVRSQSRLAMESVTLVQAEVTMFRLMMMSLAQNCWVSPRRGPREWCRRGPRQGGKLRPVRSGSYPGCVPCCGVVLKARCQTPPGGSGTPYWSPPSRSRPIPVESPWWADEGVASSAKTERVAPDQRKCATRIFRPIGRFIEFSVPDFMSRPEDFSFVSYDFFKQ